MIRNRQAMYLTRALIGMLVLAVSLVQDALAGSRLPCSHAAVFSAAAVNAIVLPYRYETKVGFDKDSAGTQLSALIQQETLFSMLKYGSVGATEIISNNGEICDVRDVIDQITRDTDRSLRSGHGVALIWGRIYEEGSQIYVQSYIRFFRRDIAETLQVDLPGHTDRELHLNGSLPSQAIALLPRRFTRNDLEEIEQRLAETLRIHKTPDDAASSEPLAESPYEPLMYGVVDVAGDWMKIRSYITGKEGWVRPRTETDSWWLRRFLPELSYLEGVIAYLRLRVATEIPLSRDPRDVYGWMHRAFSEYEKAVGKDSVPEAFGLADAMMGMVSYAQPDLLGGRNQAAEIFQRMLAQMPASAGARELAAITYPLLKTPAVANKKTLDKLNRDLLGALALSPTRKSLLQNLEQLYGFIDNAEETELYEPRELRARLVAIKKAIREIP